MQPANIAHATVCTTFTACKAAGAEARLKCKLDSPEDSGYAVQATAQRGYHTQNSKT